MPCRLTVFLGADGYRVLPAYLKRYFTSRNSQRLVFPARHAIEGFAEIMRPRRMGNRE